jgi:hypothetical protein
MNAATALPEACNKLECKNEAKYAVMINVPAVGFDKKVPVSAAIIDLRLCPHCVGKIEIAHFMDENMKMVISTAVNRFPGIKADFKNAWVSPVAFDSKEYMQFKAMRG